MQTKSEMKKRIMKNAGKAIAKFMKLTKVTSPLLAKRTGIKISDINDITKGKREPKKNEIKLICKALDIPTSVIVMYSIQEKDVPKRNRELFKEITPAIKDMIEGLVVMPKDKKSKKSKSKTKKTK